MLNRDEAWLVVGVAVRAQVSLQLPDPRAGHLQVVEGEELSVACAAAPGARPAPTLSLSLNKALQISRRRVVYI